MREMIEEKEFVVYEDDIGIAILAKNAAAKGHLVIFPKKEIKYIEELSEDELEHLFYLASYSATVLFESLGAQGTNIIANEGEEFYIEVIARSQNDGLEFQWKPQQIPSGDMEAAKSAISGSIVIGEEKNVETSKEIKEYETHEPENPPRIVDQPEDKPKSHEEDYQIKQLYRIP